MKVGKHKREMLEQRGRTRCQKRRNAVSVFERLRGTSQHLGSPRAVMKGESGEEGRG